MQHLCILFYRHFTSLGFYVAGKRLVERDSISLLDLLYVEVRQTIKLEARVVCALSPLFILEGKLFISCDFIDTGKLVLEFERIWLFILQVYIFVVILVRWARLERVFESSNGGIHLTFTIAMI